MYTNIEYDKVDSEDVLGEFILHTDYHGMHNNDVTADEKNLFDVMDEIAPIDDTCYHNLGIGLRLSISELDSLKSRFKDNSKEALKNVVSTWLQKRYSVDDFGPPTWQMLVRAVDSPAGGDNHNLAEKIASNHPASELKFAHVCIIIITRALRAHTPRAPCICIDYRATWTYRGMLSTTFTYTYEASAHEQKYLHNA